MCHCAELESEATYEHSLPFKVLNVNATYQIGDKNAMRAAAGDKPKVRVSENEQSRRMLVALGLLMIAIAVVAFRDREFLFEAASGQRTKAPNAVAAVPSARRVATEGVSVPSIETPKPVVIEQKDTTPAVAAPVTKKNLTQPSKPLSVPQASPAPKHSAAAKTNSAAEVTTQASQRAKIAGVTVQGQPEATLYPRLDQRTKVEGSVELQALVGTDGTIQELHVVRGPTVLGSAAREAVLQWKFKPYTQNGVPVETYARITVNFTIRVIDGSPKTVASVEPERVIVLADNVQR